MGCSAMQSTGKQVSTNMVLSLNRAYERKQLIGQGTFGKVYRCINKLNNQQYALKVVSLTAKTKEQAIRQINNLKTEITVLRKINHPNVIKYYSFDISPDNNQVEIVLEYAKYGSLKDLLAQNGPFSERETAGYCRQILEALKYLHGQSIVHRDLKCANILISADRTLKITDFGTAKAIKIKSNQDIARLCASLKGTPYYMAPQILKRTGHNSSADIWSFGCTLIEMLSGRAPWTGLTSKFEQIISYIISGIHPPFPENISEECECFLESCLDPVPTQRLSAEELLKHRFIDSTINHRQASSLSHNYQTPLKKQNESLKTRESRNEPDQDEEFTSREFKEDTYHMSDLAIRNVNNSIVSEYASRTRPSHKKKEIKGNKQKADVFKISDSKKLIDDNDDIDIIYHVADEPVARNLFNGKKIQQNNARVSQIKTPVQFLEDLKEIKQNTQQFDIIDLQDKEQRKTKVAVKQIVHAPVQVKKSVIDTSKQSLSGYLRSDYSLHSDYINTTISREQRNRYLEQQKKLREQKEQQRRKWQRQLRQGGDLLRKQINGRYLQ